MIYAWLVHMNHLVNMLAPPLSKASYTFSNYIECQKNFKIKLQTIEIFVVFSFFISSLVARASLLRSRVQSIILSFESECRFIVQANPSATVNTSPSQV